MNYIKENHKKIIIGLIFVLTFLVLLVSHGYGDIIVTARHGMNLWNLLFDGKLFQFFDLNIIDSGNRYWTHVYACYYNIVTYIIFAIWNIPLSIIMNLTSIDVMNNYLCLIYIKLLPVFFLLLSANVLRKIMKKIGVKEGFNKTCVFLFLSSAITLSCILVIGQYDIISVYFQLLSIYAYVKNDDKKFLLWSAIAFCCKYFSILIFLPLLIHKYKKIGKIIGYSIIMLIPFVITNLLFRVTDVGYAGGFDPNLTTQIIARLFKESSVTYPLFIIVYVCLIIWCYINKKEDYKNSFIFICLIAMASFFGLLNVYPYWCIMIVPYLILLISITPDLFEINIILETIGSICLMFGKMVKYPDCYNSLSIKTMIWNDIMPANLKNPSILDNLLGYIHDFPQWEIVPRVIFATAVGAMLYLAYKQTKKKIKVDYNDKFLIMFIRIVLVCGFNLIPLAVVILRVVK